MCLCRSSSRPFSYVRTAWLIRSEVRLDVRSHQRRPRQANETLTVSPHAIRCHQTRSAAPEHCALAPNAARCHRTLFVDSNRCALSPKALRCQNKVCAASKRRLVEPFTGRCLFTGCTCLVELASELTRQPREGKRETGAA